MQDRYAGDVGDFGKFALLRTLSPGHRLGICWYMVADETHTNDGKHLAYLDNPERFRALDQHVFDALQVFRRTGAGRSVRALEQLNLLPGAIFHADPVPFETLRRQAWYEQMRQAVDRCDLVFLNPDNGIDESGRTPKSASYAEIATLLDKNRAVLAYHHQTRRKGGAAAEVAFITARLIGHGAVHVQAVRIRPYSSRLYFLVNGSAQLYQRFESFAEHWGEEVHLFDRVG